MMIRSRMAITIAAFSVLAAFVSSGASAQGTAEQQSACTGDALQFCGADIPDVTRIEACLRQNEARLSPACRAEFHPAERTRLQTSRFRDASDDPRPR